MIDPQGRKIDQAEVNLEIDKRAKNDSSEKGKNATEKNRDEDDVTKNIELDEKIVPKDEQITLNIPRSYLHIFRKCAVR